MGTQLVRVSEEVRTALENRYPVVALEPTIFTHGLVAPSQLRGGAGDRGNRP